MGFVKFSTVVFDRRFPQNLLPYRTLLTTLRAANREPAGSSNAFVSLSYSLKCEKEKSTGIFIPFPCFLKICMFYSTKKAPPLRQGFFSHQACSIFRIMRDIFSRSSGLASSIIRRIRSIMSPLPSLE